MPTELSADVLICGATTGGVPAALVLAEAGHTVILTDHTDWVGGQLTAQAVPPDEHRRIETHGRTARYAHFRDSIRNHYRNHRDLTPEARAAEHLNPGNGWVSRLCFEPKVGHDLLMSWLAPHIESGRLKLLLNQTPIAADREADHLRSVTLRSTQTNDTTTVQFKLVLDATDTGDLLELGQVEHLIGAEHQSEFDELHAREDRADPLDQQACSWCFALTHDPHNDHTIPKPDLYETWRTYQPMMAGRPEENWSTPLFSWTVPSHNPAGRVTFPFIPYPDQSPPDIWDMWRYRRVRDAAQYTQPAEHPDATIINMVQMDYWLKPIIGVPMTERDAALRGARDLSLSLLYWMQTEAPRHDRPDQLGYPGLRLAPEITGTEPSTNPGITPGLAKSLYIREPRRLRARTMLTEHHLGYDQRLAARAHNKPLPNMDATEFGSGHPFADSIGVGHYHIDLHPSTALRNSVYVPCTPYRIPLGALIPVDTRNLIAAGKCLGVTHVANGTTRVHPSEWNIGESAGHLAAACLATNTTPEDIHASPERTADLQAQLTSAGIQIAWPWD